MKIFLQTIGVFFLLLFGLYLLFIAAELFFTNYDYVFNVFWKPDLKGNICFATAGGDYLKVIELPSVNKKIIYSTIEQGKKVAVIFDCVYSHDGRKIISEISKYKMEAGAFDLYIQSSSGEFIFDLIKNIGTDLSAPSWSSDDQQVAFSINNSEARKGLYITNIKNSYNFKRIYDKEVLGPLSWTPDDRQLIFHSVETIDKYLGHNTWSSRDYGGICIINADGSGFGKIIDRAGQAVLSPFGHCIIYTKQFSYYIAEFKDGQVLHPRKFAWRFPYWTWYPPSLNFSPDGKYIIFAKPVWFKTAGIYVASVENPSRQYRITTEDIPMYGLSWGKKVD
jgi:hypothetical protein